MMEAAGLLRDVFVFFEFVLEAMPGLGEWMGNGSREKTDAAVGP